MGSEGDAESGRNLLLLSGGRVLSTLSRKEVATREEVGNVVRDDYCWNQAEEVMAGRGWNPELLWNRRP